MGYGKEILLFCRDPSKGIDRPGILAEIALRINEMDVSLININARTNRDKIVVINMTLEINDIEQLENVISKLKKVKNIIDVYRVTS